MEVGYEEVVFLTKDDTEKSVWSNEIFVDTPENIKKLEARGFVFAIGIGEPKIRKIVAEKNPTLTYPNIIHPAATFGSYQYDEIANSKGIIITAGCRITNNIFFGDFVFVNVNTTIGHDCIIEDFVSFMTSATISGNVHIKEAAYIGCNASIIHGQPDKKLTVGVMSTIGIGAVVIKNVKDGITVYGNPARKLI